MPVSWRRTSKQKPRSGLTLTCRRSSRRSRTTPTRRAFIEKHGDDSVCELDATLTPAQPANLLEEAILDVIDVAAYESELAEEERDLEAIAQLKRQILGLCQVAQLGGQSVKPRPMECSRPHLWSA